MGVQEEIGVFLSKQPKEIARIFSLIEFCESLNIFRFKKSNTKLDLGVDLHILNYGWSMWQAAKAQSVPDTYTPIVLALEDVQSKIEKTSFLTMDAENESEVYAVDANEISAYIDELIEAQESK